MEYLISVSRELYFLQKNPNKYLVLLREY
jgi:hypothetical protein